jgi:hypothetical protein
VIGIRGWLFAGGGLAEGSTCKGYVVGEVDGLRDHGDGMPHMVGSIASYVGSRAVPGCWDHILLFKSIKHIGPQYRFILLWARLCLHPQGWYTSGCHPRDIRVAHFICRGVPWGKPGPDRPLQYRP